MNDIKLPQKDSAIVDYFVTVTYDKEEPMTVWRICAILVGVFLTVGICSAATIHVPGEQPTIQAGINTAVDGDTVLVAKGTYTGDGNRDIDFLGKTIVVMSEGGAGATIIDCEGDSWPDFHRGFYFHNGETDESVLQGFTITNGLVDDARDGGVILCENSSPTIKDNIIIDNLAGEYGMGGGVYLVSSSAVIVGNIISDNLAAWYGGGIYCGSSSPIIEGNLISFNQAGIEGGGIRCTNSSPIISRNTIVKNTVLAGDCGGIHCYSHSTPVIANCIIRNNVGDEIGSGGSYWPVVTYSNVQGGWEGEGNINANPMFVSYDKRDYRLLWDSPCIDTGFPDSLDADGTRSDMGAYFFDQDDYLTLYLTPDTDAVRPGDELGVTYTVINRQPQPEVFWFASRVVMLHGRVFPVLGPQQYTIPADYTFQAHVLHDVPIVSPDHRYEYQAAIGLLPDTLWDRDNFYFWVY